MLQQCESMPDLIESSPPSIDDVYLTPAELAARWRTDVGTLANHRSRGEGLPFVKLPTGPILYRVADVLAAEMHGARGFTWARLEAALRKFRELEGEGRERLIRHLKRELRQ